MRLLWAIIALSLSTNTFADSFPGCLIKNPCDCECSDIKDVWPSTPKVLLGKTIPAIDPAKPTRHTSSCLCPPYNKKDGRRGCLLRKEPPQIFNIFYMNICAEASPESNYFNPKIRYRTQTCNITSA